MTVQTCSRRWLALTLACLASESLLIAPAALARPVRGGVGGPASGAGVRPGAGFGAPGPGVRRGPAVGVWNPAWARGGFWVARPWATGWYRVNPVAWRWWGPSAAAWGVASLATAATITSLVNASAAQQSTVIVVPQTSYLLDFGSVQAVPPSGASFAYAVGSTGMINGQAECKQGLLGGVPPQSANQAQLLNAVCQVAYG